MNDDPNSAQTAPEVPQAAIGDKRRFSLVWLIPIVAAIAGAWLVYTTFAERGPTITITFQFGSGLEPGKTPIKYRDVQLGLVQSVTLSDDLQHVVVTARMDKAAEKELREETQFWIESARITAGGVSGLGTLLSGAYIGMRPGPGQPTRNFVALETPPVYQVDVPGKRFTLHAQKLGSVSAGSPIFFRGIEVGGVLGYQLDENGNDVSIFGFVRAPYDAFIRRDSRFWNASGIDVSLTGAGVHIRTESLQAILMGGIAFDTPVGASASPLADDNATFPLFASYDAIQEAQYTQKVPFRMYFEGSLSGLEVGAAVVSRGIKVGEVMDVHLEVNPVTLEIRVPVTISLEPQRWVVKGGTRATSPEEITQRMAKAVGAGLRGQLQSGNLLTGQLIVALQVFPDAAKAALTYEDGVPVIPTVPSDIQALTDKVNTFLDKLDKAPVAELVADLRDSVQQADRLLASASVQQGVEGLREVKPLLESLKSTSEAARVTLERAGTTMQSAGEAVGPDSALRYDLARLLKELTTTARSLRVLADFLEKNPNALILGKPAP
jgi:paraquat-inducible protein B